MIGYFIGVYKTNKTLHGRFVLRYEISLSVFKKYFTSEHSERVKYFSTLEEKFSISARPCNILYIFKDQTQVSCYFW